MFRQVKSPAYGTGISANLVSNEQRQRYNYGGRVGLVDGTSFGQNPLLSRRLPPGTPIDPTAMHRINQLDLGDMYTRENLYPKWEQTWDVDDQAGGDYVWDETVVGVSPSRTSKAEEMEKLRTEDPVQFEEMYSDWATKKYGKKKQQQKDLFTSAGITSDFLDDKPGMVSPDMGASRFEDIPKGGEEGDIGLQEEAVVKKTVMDDPMWNRENTEDIEVDPFKTLLGELDKSAEEKKKLGKGNALMQAAAAAVKWSGAGTAKERSAAISEGLTKVGETAMKAAAEGMDLKDRVKILKAMEDVKGGHKMDVWDAKLKEYYGPSMTLAKAELKIKQDTLKKLEEGQEPMAIYDEFLNDADKINVPQLKANKLHTLTNKKVEVALNDEEEKVFKMPGNDGVVFIDRNNKVVRYVDGKKETVDEKTDKYFTWKQP